MDKKSKLLFAAIFLSLAFWAVHWLYFRVKLLHHFDLINGAVCTCNLDRYDVYIHYVYHVDGRAVMKSFKTNDIDIEPCKKHFLGKSFPIAYLRDKVEQSQILITPEDFLTFNLHMPDSLKWVTQYLR